MDPVIEEIRRVGDPATIQRHVMRRWQDYLLYTLQPKLDRLAALDMAAEQQARGKVVKA